MPRGGKLATGLGLLVAGTLVAAIVIFAGHSSDGLQGTPPMSYQQLWAAVLAGHNRFGNQFRRRRNAHCQSDGQVHRVHLRSRHWDLHRFTHWRPVFASVTRDYESFGS